MEREVRMQERREREDKEREEAYRKSLEDLPPLKPIVDDGQVPGTSGIRSSVELKTPPLYQYEESEPSDYEEESEEATGGEPSLRERSKFGEDDASKGKSGENRQRKEGIKADIEAEEWQLRTAVRRCRRYNERFRGGKNV